MGSQSIVDLLNGEGFYTDNDWPKILGVCIAALVTWFLGSYLHKKSIKDAYKYEDDDSPLSPYSFFFVPFRYCSFVMLGLMLMVLSSRR